MKFYWWVFLHWKTTNNMDFLGEFSVTERQQKLKYDCLCSSDFCRWKYSNFWDFNNLEIYAIRVQLSIKSKKLCVFTIVLYRFLTFLSIIHFCNILIFLCHNIMYNMHFKRLAVNLPIYFCLNHIYLLYVHHLFLCLTQIIFVYQSISIHLKKIFCFYTLMITSWFYEKKSNG